MIAVSAAACYLPAASVPVADLLAGLDPGERETCAALGIERVPADDTLGPTELAARAGRRALAEAGLDPSDIDVVLTVESRAPDTLVSSEATRLQAVLGADRAMAFTVGGLGCASLTPALLAARGLLCADPGLANVLILHGSKPATPHRYRHPVTVNGDSGAALVITRDGPVRVRDILLETNGAYADLFRVHYRDRIAAQWREECADPPTYSFRLAVETRNRLRSLTAALLTRNGLGPDDIACYLTQNLSQAAFQSWAEALGVPIAKPCLANLAQHGHLGPNDLVLNLGAAIETGHLAPGDRAVLLNISPAAAWSALLVETGAPAGGAHHL
ncbi:MAG TPA: 3-oxoacyl-[acyl-carrier-protein] synthase III C-terminal domain-containing protein [Actinophytocola sp.]|uniref:3-oxoacyl-[acyl-carrier-protein] synthase III C-terminal domain-containing protein n=1 Tax=Actinophytocola sp. TaxID=1872138 RepID=UPI002DB92EDA|nr:3-oxoacyl-[acyl-carrier-protein] synthase III C-terminal domain-containing protein [Actinophytocola sp.]HEU5470745.1 3-oxoacyl-[acyl-carrier-protein] synthase III C-terminal domain-containing protein [Actinophytocola sp.]